MSAGTVFAWIAWLVLVAAVIGVCAWVDNETRVRRAEVEWRARFDAMPQTERDAGCERLLAAIRTEVAPDLRVVGTLQASWGPTRVEGTTRRSAL